MKRNLQRILMMNAMTVLVSPAVQALCISTQTANLRAGPGPQYTVTWIAPLYTPLVEIKRAGGWIQVEDMSGDLHWVFRTSVTSKITCVSARWNTVRLRKAPGANAELAEIKFVDKFTAFKRIDAQDEWYEVEASWGENYWVHESTVWRPVKIAKVQF